MTWIAWHAFSEASSGTTPTTVADGASSPEGLTITFAGAGAWTSIGAGNGLDTAGGTRCVSTSSTLVGTKYDALEASTEMSVEAVLTFPITDNKMPSGLGPGGGFPGPYTYEWYSTSGDISFDGIGNGSVTWACQWDMGGVSAGVHVLQTIYDSAASAGSRVIYYLDGVAQSKTGTEPTASLGLDLPTGTRQFIASSATTASHSYQLPIYWHAIASHAADATECADRADALLLDNDADPDGGTPATTSTVAGVIAGFTGAATVTETIPSTVAGTFGGFTAAATVDSGSVFTSTVAGALAGFTGAVTVVETIPGTCAGVWAALVAAATVTETIPGTTASVWPEWTCAGDANIGSAPPVSSTVAASWPELTGAATMSERIPVTVAGEWAALVCSATVTQAPPITTAVTATWPGWGAAADVTNDDGVADEILARNRGRRRWRGSIPQ